MSKELIENLKNRDTDKIKEMFCSVVSESEGFDDQLQEAVEFIDREIVYYDNDIYGMERMKTSPGKTTIAFIAPQITNVETDTNKIYSVRFYAYLLNYDHPEYEGITMAVITRMSDSKVCVIGNISLAPSPD